MVSVEINFLAVFIGAVLSMVIGFLWYGPFLFGNVWMKLKGYSVMDMKKSQKEMGKWYGLSFLTSLITSFAIAHVMFVYQYFMGAESSIYMTAFYTALFMWFAFVMTTQLTATIFGNKNWKLLAIDTGYQLVTLMAMAFTVAVL